MRIQAHIYIKGDVIGVGFRAWVKVQAKIHGVEGWVRNSIENPDILGPGGGIEAVFQGEEECVHKMLELVKKGPSISHVEDTQVTMQDPSRAVEGFEIRK